MKVGFAVHPSKNQLQFCLLRDILLWFYPSQHRSTEADHRTAYTSPEVTHLPGSFQAPAMHVLFITTQLYIWEDFLKPGRTDDVARVVRQLVIQRIGTAVAHDRLFREVAKHPRNEQG